MAPALAAERLPNIVYILADDLGWGDLGCYNAASGVPTPNADRLASQGVRFTDMHSPSAVCTPTRYGIMTGRYCWRTSLKNGVLWGYSPNLIEPGRLTVPAMLKARGYYTAGVGKWHLGLGDREKTDYAQPLRPGPATHGFDYYFGIPASLDMDPYLYFENDRVVEQPTAHTEGSKTPRGVFWRAGGIASARWLRACSPRGPRSGRRAPGGTYRVHSTAPVPSPTWTIEGSAVGRTLEATPSTERSTPAGTGWSRNAPEATFPDRSHIEASAVSGRTTVSGGS
jgi:arylsulfatase A-like enzyme